jgi:hypothetical protein
MFEDTITVARYWGPDVYLLVLFANWLAWAAGAQFLESRRALPCPPSWWPRPWRHFLGLVAMLIVAATADFKTGSLALDTWSDKVHTISGYTEDCRRAGGRSQYKPSHIAFTIDKVRFRYEGLSNFAMNNCPNLAGRMLLVTYIHNGLDDNLVLTIKTPAPEKR